MEGETDGINAAYTVDHQRTNKQGDATLHHTNDSYISAEDSRDETEKYLKRKNEAPDSGGLAYEPVLRGPSPGHIQNNEWKPSRLDQGNVLDIQNSMSNYASVYYV